ncbi:DUF4145 domain-containing protein [Micromonospora craniellae]|uniref:DUF4145 domain-containing protein n=1 Tax=Micromonospora craniellae TaxID=2294034 RepID=A0A372FUE3_9ACTN|nr:DUF4145 domain-containing protein [Micromonospora craniellae]QOC94725.1 DUF4145 domain-containing protein [Micromonospora craniellae]RFS44407.1 DUF4145 domain-containing protein [Micromonospora craniellae]
MPHPLLALADEFVDLPDLICPTCRIGRLTVPKPWVTGGDAATTEARRQRPDDFEPDWITGVFTGILECPRDTCQERIAVTGGWRLAISPDAAGPYLDVVRLTYARPALILVDCPPGTPDRVTAACRAAAEIVWVDPSGAANRLRVAVEELLTAQGVPRTASPRSPGGRRRRIKTHERIELLAKRKPKKAHDAVHVLMAVKFIGNAGSHDSSLTIKQVLECAEMLGLALTLLYDPTQATLMRRVRAVTRKHGWLPSTSRSPTAAG